MPILSNLESVTIDSMGQLTLPSLKRNPARQWRLLDLVSTAFFAAVLFFFLPLFTSLGDSLEASGRQALLRLAADPQRQHRMVELMKVGHQQTVEACPADAVNHMP